MGTYDSPMRIDGLIERMGAYPASLHALLRGLPEDDARWRPPSGAWSIVEIVTHMADEEIEDFRARLESMLRDPTEPWPPIDPEAAATDRRYNERDLDDSLRRFAAERAKNVEWLRAIDNPNWDNVYQHPRVGPVLAGELMVSWACHDQLHLRQIAKRLYELARRDGEPYPAGYAGGEF